MPPTRIPPSSTPVPTTTSTSTSTPIPRQVRLTVIYNNIPFDPNLQTDWGFACLVEADQTTVLFDTGGSGNILLNNMSLLDIKPEQIDAIAISHQHGDHTGGLAAIASLSSAPLYLPVEFSEGMKSVYRSQNRLMEVHGWTEIGSGIYLTGTVGSGIVEQALVVETAKGLVVVTGCAHPGIAQIVQHAREHGEIYLVMGGFHLSGHSAAAIQQIIATFKDLGVKKAAPSHCSGALAIQMFHDAYGEDFIPSGAGAVILP